MKVLLIVLLLVGCASAPLPPEIVKVPVHVPCVKSEPTRPEFEVERLPADASDGAKVLALARDLPMHLKYQAQLLAVVEGCK